MRANSVLVLVAALSIAHAAVADVSVTGAGSVGVGQMSGGSIQIGLTQAQLESALKSSGAEQAARLRDLTSKVNQAVARMNANLPAQKVEEVFSSAVVHGFLATVVGKRVPEADWPRVFNELAGRYLELGDRIAAVSASSDRMKLLLRQADEALKPGDLSKVDALLGEAQEVTLAEARQQASPTLQERRQSARLLAARASVAFSRLERELGASLLVQAVGLRRDDFDSEVFRWLSDAGDTRDGLGDATLALQLRHQARDSMAALSTANPLNNEWRRQWAVSQDRLGDSLRHKGDVDAALESYLMGLSIRQQLTSIDATNTLWQRDLAISHERIGDSLVLQGKRPKAGENFQASLAIRKRLTAADPMNTEWQRDLSISQSRIGDNLRAQGDGDGALQYYRASLAVRQALATSVPSNSVWQRDLSIAHEKLADHLRTAGDLASALQDYEASLAIRQRLAALDPTHIEWQRDLAVACLKLGVFGASVLTVPRRVSVLMTGLDALERLSVRGHFRSSDTQLVEAFKSTLSGIR